MNTSTQSYIFYQSLNRHFTVMGVDKSYFYLNCGLSFPIIFATHFKLLVILFSVSIFLSLHFLGLYLTNLDPLIFALFKRHIHFPHYFSAQPNLNSQLLRNKASVPVQGKFTGGIA